MEIKEDELLHYGILRRSGRYPWGSGGNQSTRNKGFLDYVADMKAQGLSETDIAKGLGITTTALRAARSIAKTEQRQAKIAQAQKLKDKGLSQVAIGQRMGIPESSVRALLAPGQKEKADILQTTADMLKSEVAKKGVIDVGRGVEVNVGVSSTKLNTAVAMLGEEGYEVYYLKIPQLGTGKDTTMKVIAPPGTSYSEVYANRDKVRQIQEHTVDGGRSFLGITPPVKVDPARLDVRYAEDGGTQEDGVIYVRPGSKDLSLGGSQYAQVRIAVGDNHYLKGMAVYKDDLPDGVDLLFNTSKERSSDKMAALKEMSDDPDNPFGALIKRQEGAMNIVYTEGDWSGWSKTLSSQVLSKQSPSLAREQLDKAFDARQREFDEIMALTNPTVKRDLLMKFADNADSASVHLKAAQLPRQRWHVILPVENMAPNQIYAPNYRDGERVVLIRYPHGGTFEIPELVVNNKQPDASKLLGQARDAVGIHSSVAERLSGADFDGDSVLVIPNGQGKVKTSPALDNLKNFDPRSSYKGYDGMKVMSPRTKQIEMGVVSNLITDMTIHKASASELARAVRHSMVVIDAEKHGLDYKRSAAENGIAALKEKYQGGARSGASTLISRATSQIRVPDRKPRSAANGGPIDPKTGKKVYEPTNVVIKGKDGQERLKTITSQRLAETGDAFTLTSGPGSGTPMERVYATYSNNMKGLANRARKVALATPPLKYSPSAKKVYSDQVATLNSKLQVALRNSPLERQAQVIANSVVRAKKESNPSMDQATLKKIKGAALVEARSRVGARKQKIDISPLEWEAIQAGAISDNKLRRILANSDPDTIRKLATPKQTILMSPDKVRRAKALLSSGATRAQVADVLGVSLTTLDTSVDAE